MPTNGSTATIENLTNSDVNKDPSDPNQPDKYTETDTDQIYLPRHSLRGIIPKKQWDSTAAMMKDNGNDSYERDQYHDATNFPEADKWRVALKIKYESLMKYETWRHDTLPPPLLKNQLDQDGLSPSN
ncbi:hypothetical protein DAPPUDRAFT_256479 [Daphnia pulex]|uniref:Uncharacterized protein n=1 Tax=Daphnia pulex TaxID=6669 RepID=E9HBG1_DAPPU|nr:hypothetical protein DAPPUDRAFT_256479 [Daphnia pulex]|eukprot:EFX70836.1 hypothetical protein DAPPUDRAFT_256479 [Daphnia pulex]